jgi:hypothetical protein
LISAECKFTQVRILALLLAEFVGPPPMRQQAEPSSAMIANLSHFTLAQQFKEIRRGAGPIPPDPNRGCLGSISTVIAHRESSIKKWLKATA